MFIEQTPVATMSLESGLNEALKAKKPLQRRRRAQNFVCGVLILLACASILFYFTNTFRASDPLIDYNKYPFLKLISLKHPKIKWNVFVDTPNNQVFLVKKLNSSSMNSKRLLTANLPGDHKETTITQVILQKFDADHINIYHLFEGGDFDHIHCFKYPMDPSSKVVPQFKASQFSVKNKTWVNDTDKYELRSDGSGHYVGIHTDSENNLLQVGFYNKYDDSGLSNLFSSRDNMYQPFLGDPDNYPTIEIIPDAGEDHFDTPEFKAPDFDVPDFDVPDFGDFGEDVIITRDILLLRNEHFDIDRIKTKLDENLQCFEYNPKFKAPEISYQTSKMRLSPKTEWKSTKESVMKKEDSSQQGGLKVKELTQKEKTNSQTTNSPLVSIHGNWCGPNRGGFYNNCTQVCKQDLWGISEDCAKCAPPVDYADKQCMSLALCLHRYNSTRWSYDDLKGDSGSIPCECIFQALHGLEEESVLKGCEKNDQVCVEAGKEVRKELLAQPCDCKVAKCVSLPEFEQNKSTRARKCVNYDAYLPPKVCKSMSKTA